MMQKTNKIFVIIFSVINIINAQSVGDVGLSFSANYSMPIAGLQEWFKPAIDYSFKVGQQTNTDWYVEGGIEYSIFKEDNLSGYIKDKVELSLEHLGLIINGKYTLGMFSNFKPYLNIGGGLYYWKGIRGRIEADTLLTPVVPLIEKKVQEEWNWGFRSGIGLEVKFSENIACDINAHYRFIVGDLWPTLQPHILLENVSGFQTFNLALNLNYYFKQ